MSVTPTFGRYAEIPVDQMTAERKEGYRSRPTPRLRTKNAARKSAFQRPRWRR